MKKADVLVRRWNERVPQRGYQTDVPGLLVWKSEAAKSWHLVHESSGFLVGPGFRLMKQAEEAAKKLSEFDWTLSDTEIRQTKGLHKQVLEL